MINTGVSGNGSAHPYSGTPSPLSMCPCTPENAQSARAVNMAQMQEDFYGVPYHGGSPCCQDGMLLVDEGEEEEEVTTGASDLNTTAAEQGGGVLLPEIYVTTVVDFDIDTHHDPKAHSIATEAPPPPPRTLVGTPTCGVFSNIYDGMGEFPVVACDDPSAADDAACSYTLTFEAPLCVGSQSSPEVSRACDSSTCTPHKPQSRDRAATASARASGLFYQLLRSPCLRSARPSAVCR